MKIKLYPCSAVRSALVPYLKGAPCLEKIDLMIGEKATKPVPLDLGRYSGSRSLAAMAPVLAAALIATVLAESKTSGESVDADPSEGATDELS